MTIEKTFLEKTSYQDEYFESIEKINKIFLQYGLTPNQSKIYLHLTKSSEKTASEISKTLKIPRTETYHLLNSLEEKGIIYSIFGKPYRFNAVPIDDAINVLISNEKKRISELESKKKTILSIWKTLPEFGSNFNDAGENKFQILQGKNSILVKVEQMTKTAQFSIQLLGSEANFIKFYHTDLIEFLKNTKAHLEILTTFSEKGNYVFEELTLNNIKRLNENQNDNFSFIIKDDSQVLFFINPNSSPIAIWTDSKSFVTTLKALFKLIWKRSKYVLENDDATEIKNQYEHRLREIEQEKLILDYCKKKFFTDKGGVKFE
ncbi:MAG: TrmB family transcriptional regulator [Nitrosopumilaceae archaeon]|nr:TrmB family transcriptional regulator [Nitrosopumilaceae archaeon]NIU01983.1 TrmB family transcriptional regulator [Nitrosopumilaceae archaeon]NIU87134.1 TrmB family transcriptional regulator [Nitrosopumilaceae archaeon]NIV64624.1 TrmB family transcriptional regulator [Nitrosopumilaceae archaeon]NIX62584.1 TrmB family transcriptional regulator [Nitrosopumilaceae archaeon]